MNNNLPEHLVSMIDILKKAFTEDIKDNEYKTLICILYEECSNRGVARIIENAFEIEYEKAMIDILETIERYTPNESDKEDIVEKLNPYGFQDWLIAE